MKIIIFYIIIFSIGFLLQGCYFAVTLKRSKEPNVLIGLTILFFILFAISTYWLGMFISFLTIKEYVCINIMKKVTIIWVVVFIVYMIINHNKLELN